MTTKISAEKFWKLFETLPNDLKEALSSPKIGEDIFDICQRNKISEKAEEVLDCTTLVLLGLLSPKDLQYVLEKELKMDNFISKKVSQEIFRFVFFPVKGSLDVLYKESGVVSEAEVPYHKKSEQESEAQQDVYREPVE